LHNDRAVLSQDTRLKTLDAKMAVHAAACELQKINLIAGFWVAPTARSVAVAQIIPPNEGG